MVDNCRISQRRQYPLTQQATTHRGDGCVYCLQERALPRAGAEGLDQFQIAPSHVVDPQELVASANYGAGQVGQSGRLEVGQVPEQCPCRAYGVVVVGGDTQAVEGGEPEAPGDLV